MFKLRNWYLEVNKDNMMGISVAMAHGDVFGNPEFPDGYNIHTSMIEETNVMEDAIILHTYSGSYYELRFDEIKRDLLSYYNSTGFSDRTKEALEFLNISDKVDIDRFQELTKTKEVNKLKDLQKVLKPDELYLEVGDELITLFAAFRVSEMTPEILSDYQETYLSYYEDMVVVPVTLHAGMFKDSVLVRYFGVVDYRYFPEGYMCTYHWSDNLMGIRLKNIGAQELTFNNMEFSVKCLPGETIEIPRQEDNAEGLISPDAYNGKSLFSVPNQEEIERLLGGNEELESK